MALVQSARRAAGRRRAGSSRRRRWRRPGAPRGWPAEGAAAAGHIVAVDGRRRRSAPPLCRHGGGGRCRRDRADGDATAGEERGIGEGGGELLGRGADEARQGRRHGVEVVLLPGTHALAQHVD